MKASELKEKSVDELEKQLVELNKERFGYRMQQSTGQLGQTHLLKEVARNIARVKTVINQKQQAAASDKA